MVANELNHPAEQTLKSYSLGSLDDTESSAVEQHITECEPCRRVVEETPADSLVGLLRASMSRPCDDATAAEVASVMTPEPGSTASTLDSHPPLYKRVAQLLGDTGSTASAKPQAGSVAPPAGLADHARYQVLDHLGSGGMGTVFKAQHRLMNRTVAIKVINPALLGKPSVKERFMREVKAAAQLAHVHIVTAYDAEQSGEMHLLVMEFVQGETLADRIRRDGPLPVTEACGIVRQAALGLQHAYERGMVHRDIKPANIMIDTGGRTKLMDFGLACFHSENTSVQGITELGAIMGTPDYMAPEQALDPHTADIRADIYSLGCTLYHALAGQVPYPATTPLAKIDAHRAGRATALRAFRPDVPAELSAVVERMMTKDPAKRFQTPAEVADALLPFTLPKTTTPPVRRRRFPLVAAVILLALAPLSYFFGPTVFRFVTNQGVLIIETDDKDIKVTAWQGKDAVEILDVQTGKSFTLSAGTYQAKVSEGKAGLTLETSEFILKRGGRIVVKVTWDPTKHLAGRLDPPVIETADTLRKAFDSAMAKNQFPAAAELAAKLLKLKPDEAESHYSHGLALLLDGKRTEAISDFNKALALDPNHRRSLTQRSFAFLNTEQFDLAIADCDRVLKLESKGEFAVVALLNRGGAWAHKGRFDKGYADFDAAFKLESNDTSLLWKGIILKRMGDEAKGQAEIDKVLKHSPNLKDYGFNRLDHVVPQPPPLDEWLQGREVLTVSQDGKAKFKTIGAALDALQPGQVVKVLDKGPYKETLDKNLPENVGLISEVGTRIELDKWNRGAATPWDPKKFFYHNHVLRCPRNLRVSGFDIVGHKAEGDAGFSIVLNLTADGDLVVEGCRVFFTETERQTPPKPGDPNLPVGRIDFNSWSNQPGQIWIRDNYFGRHVTVGRPGTSIVMERNRIVDPHHEAFHIWAGTEPVREFIARHNVFEGVLGIKIDGTKAPTDLWLKTPVSIVNNLFEVTKYGVWFSAGDEEKKGWYPRNVRIQNNIIRAADRSGVMLSAKGMSEVRDAWRVSNNCYPYEPGGTGNMQTFSRGPSDKIEPKPFLSDDPKHADYLRISPKSSLATGGAGGDLPLYIGPHAPGQLAERAAEDKKALGSLQGDWTLVSRETNGWKPSDETSKNHRLTIKGDQWILNPGPSGTITIDNSKDPKWFDVSNYSLGIYKLEGDTLTICRLSKAWTTERPKDFRTTKDDRNVVLVYKRSRPLDSSSANVVPQPASLEEWLQGREVVTVAQDGSGQYKRIDDALSALKPGQAIKVLDKGPYREMWKFNLPEDVGLFSEVGTRVELPEWNRGTKAEEKGKFFDWGSSLNPRKGFRLSGFEFVSPKLPADAAGGRSLDLWVNGDVVVEKCRILYSPGYGPVPPASAERAVISGILFLGLDTNPKSRLFVQDNYWEGGIEAHHFPATIVMQRNLVRYWTGSGISINQRTGDIILRNNVIQARFGISFQTFKSEKEELAPSIVVTNNLLDVLYAPIGFYPLNKEEKDRLPLSKNVRIQNNILRSPGTGGIAVPLKELATAKAFWKIGYNCYLSDPSGEGVLSVQPTDQVHRSHFLSADPKHADYLRIVAGGALAQGGLGGSLPTYIGPLTPGPAPKEGDWFTRLTGLSVATEKAVGAPVGALPFRTFGSGDPSTIFDVAFSPSGKMLAAGGVDGRINVWDTASEKLLKTFEVPKRLCYSLAFSPDEKTLITGSGNNLGRRESKSGELRVWDLSTGQFETLDFFADPVTAVAYSPDGRLFASVAPGVDNKTKNPSTKIKIWDARTKTVKQTLKGHPRIWSLGFSPDGKLLASGGLPGGDGVKLWDIEKGEEIGSINLGTTLGYSVVFSPKPGVLAICSGMGSPDRKSDTAVVVLWDYHAKKEIKRFGDFSGNSYRPAFSKQGDLLACGTGSRLRLFDMNKHEEIAVIPSGWQVRAVAFSPDDRSLAAVWSDGVVAMWSVSDLRALRSKTVAPVISPPFRTFGTGDPSIVYAAGFSPSGKMLASGGGFSPTESGVRLWDTTSEKLLKSLQIPNRLCYSLAFSPDEKTIITASGNIFARREINSGELRVWDLSTGQFETLDTSADPVTAVAYSADGKLFASIATRADNQTKNPFAEIKIWDAKTKTVKQTFQGHASAIWSLAFSPDGKLLAYGSGNGVKLWDIEKGEEKTTVNLGLPVAYSVAFSPKPGVMAICGGKTRSPDRREDTGLFVLFDYHANKQIMRFQTSGGYAYRVAFSKQGDLLACGASSHLFVLDMAKNEKIAEITSASKLRPVAFSPNDEYLAAGCDDGVVRVWSVSGLRSVQRKAP